MRGGCRGFVNGRKSRCCPTLSPAFVVLDGRKLASYCRLSGVSWWKRLFRTDHAKMNRDPAVWSKVEALILDAVKRESAPIPIAHGGD